MKETSVVPGLYRHYKGGYYKVIGVARHSETLEEVVLYQSLSEKSSGEGDLWVRALKMFQESVTVEGQKVPRFRRED